MRSRDFCYWLKGYFELSSGTRTSLAPEAVDCIKRHLALVFKHEIDPSIDGGDPAKKQELDTAHNPEFPGAGPVYRC